MSKKLPELVRAHAAGDGLLILTGLFLLLCLLTGAQIRANGMTQLAVSGASGKTGWRVVEEALKRGRSVRAIVRPGSVLPSALAQAEQEGRLEVCRLEPWVYFGDYSLRGKGERGLATAFASGSEEDLSIQFNPAIEPGQTVKVVCRGFNPQSSIYQWSIELLADGEDPVRYLGPILRLNVYEQDPYR